MGGLEHVIETLRAIGTQQQLEGQQPLASRIEERVTTLSEAVGHVRQSIDSDIGVRVSAARTAIAGLRQLVWIATGILLVGPAVVGWLVVRLPRP